MTRIVQEQTVHFLSDLYSVELQALAQMAAAPRVAGDPFLARDFELHEEETRRQADRLKARLDVLGGSASAVKEAVMRLGGKGFLLFANLLTETPGRLVVHAYSYEAMEWAAYAVLIRLAEVGGDLETAVLAREIQAEERTMMERLERNFGVAEQAAHGLLSPGEVVDHVRKHLAEAHALNLQSGQLLARGADTSEDPALAASYRRALEESRLQERLIEDRLKSIHAGPSALEDGALRLGALNWTLFFRAQRDTPCKLLAFAYAVEHLAIAGYELLKRTANRADDSETEAVCQRLADGKRIQARHLAAGIDRSVEETLRGVAGREEWRKAS